MCKRISWFNAVLTATEAGDIQVRLRNRCRRRTGRVICTAVVFIDRLKARVDTGDSAGVDWGLSFRWEHVCEAEGLADGCIRCIGTIGGWCIRLPGIGR